MRTATRGPSVGLHMGPRSAVLGEGMACALRHWGLRWNSLWGHEPCDGCTETGLRWAGRTHANCATGDF
eukprot:4452497-Pyramimonas_sp.AAC.1